MPLLQKLFFETQWNIGWKLVKTQDLSSLDDLKKVVADVRFLKKGRFYFLADPFIIDAEKRLLVAEYYHFFKGYGELVLLQFDDDGNILWMKKVDSKSAHYSYPFVLKENGRISIFPESCMDGCQKRIELDGEDHDILREEEVIPEVKIVDGTLYKWAQDYYLFANPLDNFNEELWIYKSASPSGPWIGVSKLKGKNLRGAGSFFDLNGKLYRPSQMNEQIYGGGLVINQVLEMNGMGYAEVEVDRIMPIFNIKKKVTGNHTLNMEGSLLVTDIRYQEFLWWKPFYKLFIKARQSLFP